MNITDNLTLGTTTFGPDNAPTIAITHGWATDHNFLLPFVDIFPNNKVILIDMPGYGRSKHLAQFSNNLRQTANLLLNTLPVGCILVSWSISTLAGTLACSQDKEHKISKFISICGTPRFPFDPHWPGFDYKYVLKSFKLFEKGQNDRTIKMFFKLQTQSHLLSESQKDFLLDSFEKMGQIETSVLKSGLDKMASSDYREALLSTKISCLHIFGGKDRLVKPELSNILFAPPYHMCSVLENSAHLPFLTEPEELRKIIEIFIKNSN